MSNHCPCPKCGTEYDYDHECAASDVATHMESEMADACANAVAEAIADERKRLAAILREVAKEERGWGTDPADLLCQVADRVDEDGRPAR